jgi:hypothetical protein
MREDRINQDRKIRQYNTFYILKNNKETMSNSTLYQWIRQLTCKGKLLGR